MSINIENPHQLITYLEQNTHISPGEKVNIRVLHGGVSNRTVWLERENGADWVLKQALHKLRVKEDWYSNPDRIEREALGMQWLSKLTSEDSIPQLVFLDKVNHLLAMTAVPLPHHNFKEKLLEENIEHEDFRKFGNLLGHIHSNAQKHSQELSDIFFDQSYFETLRLEPYYKFTAQRLSEAKEFLDILCRDCRTDNYTLVHGDYSPKNILIHKQHLILLDHEVIHFGDGTFDIGFALCHFLSKANHLLEDCPEILSGARLFWSSYGKNEHVTPERENRAVKHTLGCLLARVHGRSTLEYLTSGEKAIQTSVVLKMIRDIPPTILDMIERFAQLLADDRY